MCVEGLGQSFSVLEIKQNFETFETLLSRRCQPMSGTAHGTVPVLTRRLLKEIMDPKSDFQDRAFHTLKVAMMAHGQWPSDLSIELPNSNR